MQRSRLCLGGVVSWMLLGWVALGVAYGQQVQPKQADPVWGSGSEMANFAEAFGLNATDWKVQQTACTAGGNVLTAGQSATFTFFIQPGVRAYKGPVRLEVIPYGTRWRKESPQRPVVFRQGESVSTHILEGEIPVEGAFVDFTPEIGETFGGYVLVMELEGWGRAFAGSVVRSLTAELPLDEIVSTNGIYNGVLMASTEDRMASVSAVQRMLGLSEPFYVRAANMITEQSGQIGGVDYAVTQAWAPAAALGAVQAYLAHKDYKGTVFGPGFPWVFIFEEPKAKRLREEGTLVVVGDLTSICNPNALPLRSVQLRPGASVSLENRKNEFVSTDFYGNELESVGGQIIIPLNGSGYFLRTRGAKGSFRRLLAAVRQAEIRNVEPVELVVQDFTTSVTNEDGVLSVQVSNVLNRKVKGGVQILVPGIVFQNDSRELNLQPFQSKRVEFPWVGYLSQERDGNNYPLIVAWTDEGGVIKHAETLHINSVAKHTPTVDGQLQDWKDCLSYSMPISRQEWNPFEPYQPFRDWPNGTVRNTLSVWLGWDESNFYCAGRLPSQVLELGNDWNKRPYSITFAVGGDVRKKKSVESVFRLSLSGGGQAECRCLSNNGLSENNLLENATVSLRGQNWEVAVPWSQMPEVYALVRKGKLIQFTTRVQVGELAWELANGRSVSQQNNIPENGIHWQNTIKFAVEGSK